MRDHALIEELLSARALGGIEPEDEARLRAEMAEHGDCEECARLERELGEIAGRLAFALDPVPVGRELEERTLAPARTPRPTRTDVAEPARIAPRRGTPRWVRPLIAAAAAVALFAGGWLVGNGGGSPPFPVEGGRVAAFEGASGTLALVYRPGERGLYVVGSNVEAPAERSTYELWLFHGSTPVSAGCFEPSTGGAVLRFVDASLGGAQTAAVTIESTACPEAPTTEPVFTATL